MFGSVLSLVSSLLSKKGSALTLGKIFALYFTEVFALFLSYKDTLYYFYIQLYTLCWLHKVGKEVQCCKDFLPTV